MLHVLHACQLPTDSTDRAHYIASSYLFIFLTHLFIFLILYLFVSLLFLPLSLLSLPVKNKRLLPLRLGLPHGERRHHRSAAARRMARTAGRSARVLLLERFDLHAPGLQHLVSWHGYSHTICGSSHGPRRVRHHVSATPTAYPSRSTRPWRQ